MFFKGIFPSIDFVAVKEEPFTVDEQEEEVVTVGWNTEDKYQFESCDSENQGNIQKYREVQFLSFCQSSVNY